MNLIVSVDVTLVMQQNEILISCLVLNQHTRELISAQGS